MEQQQNQAAAGSRAAGLDGADIETQLARNKGHKSFRGSSGLCVEVRQRVKA